VLALPLFAQYTPPSGGGGGGGSPAGSAGCVQLYGTSTTFACDATFLDVAASHLVEIGGAPITPFAGLYIGPDENTLDSNIQGYASPQALLVTSSGKTGLSVEVDGTGTGEFGVSSVVLGTTPEPFYAWTNISGSGGDPRGFSANAYILNNTATPVAVYGYWGAAIELDGGSTSAQVPAFFQFYSAALGGTSTNPYSFWSDEAGVFRIRADNTFNSVYQAIPALYNPQVTKYVAGATDFERCIPGCQWESNVAVITTEKGGSFTLRSLQLGDAGVSVTFGGLLVNHSVAFAALGTPANGTQYYCSDCTVTSGVDNTCAASGTGSWTERINGAWKCWQ